MKNDEVGVSTRVADPEPQQTCGKGAPDPQQTCVEGGGSSANLSNPGESAISVGELSAGDNNKNVSSNLVSNDEVGVNRTQVNKFHAEKKKTAGSKELKIL